MEDLIKSYNLDFKNFRGLLIKHDAVIAGSSVLSVYLDNKFKSNDIDVWVKCSNSISSFLPIYKDISKFLYKCGYDDEVIDKKDITNENTRYSNLPTGRHNIVKVVEFSNPEEKKIQFVFVSTDPLIFIEETFDLSICKTVYNPLRGTITTLDEEYTKAMKMYISYGKSFDELHPKNKQRVQKYIDRGFTLVPKPLPVFLERDKRIFTKEFRIKVEDIIALDELDFCEFLKESDEHIVLKINKAYYGYNRKDLVRELTSRRSRPYGLLPTRQAISNNDIIFLQFADYSIYELKPSGVKTSDSAHIIYLIKTFTVKQFEEKYIIDGTRDGICKKYYCKDKLKSETPYVNDLKNGLKKKYNTDGQLCCETPYTNNKIDGDKKVYVNGKLAETLTYQNGHLIKKILYFTDGTINVVMHFYENKLSGQYIEFDKSNNVISTKYYEAGELVDFAQNSK